MDIPPESCVVDHVSTIAAGGNMHRRWIGVIGFVAAVAVALAPPAGALGTSLLNDGFSTYPVNVSWADGSVHGNWKAVYNGYGVTKVVSDASRSGNVLQEKP